MEEDFYTTGQAAKILKVSDRGVRKMIDRGELEDSPDERGRHRIPQREVHRLLQERREASPGAAGEADTTESPQASQEAAELRARVYRGSSCTKSSDKAMIATREPATSVAWVLCISNSSL